jgi:hypothetical protein
MDWYRNWHDTPRDGKLGMIAKRAGARRCEMTAFWDCLMDYASQQSERGCVGGIDLEVIAFEQEIELEVVQAMYLGLEAKGVIVGGRLANWDKRQPKREDGSAERAKAWREQQKAERTQPNATERSVTPMNAPEGEGDIELDLDSENEVVLGGGLSVAHMREARPLAAIPTSQSARIAERAEAAAGAGPPQKDHIWWQELVTVEAAKAGVDPATMLAEIDVGDQTDRWRDRDKGQRISWRNWMRKAIEFYLRDLNSAPSKNGAHNGNQRPTENRALAATAASIGLLKAATANGRVDQGLYPGGPGDAEPEHRGRTRYVDGHSRSME